MNNRCTLGYHAKDLSETLIRPTAASNKDVLREVVFVTDFNLNLNGISNESTLVKNLVKIIKCSV